MNLANKNAELLLEEIAQLRQQLAEAVVERDAETQRANMAEAKHDLVRATLDRMVKITTNRKGCE